MVSFGLASATRSAKISSTLEAAMALGSPRSRASFRVSIARIPKGGHLFVDATDARAVAIAAEACSSPISHYALDGQKTSVTPEWLAFT